MGLFLATAACGRGVPHPAPPPPKPFEAKPRWRPPPPAEWFWESIETDVHPPTRKPLELPLAVEIGRIEGAARMFDELAPEARERIKRDGVLVLDAPADAGPRARSMGAFY